MIYYPLYIPRVIFFLFFIRLIFTLCLEKQKKLASVFSILTQNTEFIFNSVLTISK